MRYLNHCFLLVILFISTSALGQHEHHQMADPKEDQKVDSKDSTEMPLMSHAFSRNLPMTRNGSGTGWMPDATTMYGHGIHTKNWMYMFMGNVFVRYNKQDLTNEGKRGGEKFDVPNWFMFMGQRNVGYRGLFRFSAMLSLDPFTIGNEGYPLLFQSGETYNGKRLVDRQHPHDLFSELSVGYTHMISRDMDVSAYLGYPGEPALGPVAFMHRNSALNNPDAPLSHHWQDATHISFGVATLGLRYKMFKLEASSFTGREPNEMRYDFDKPRFDSYSFRLLSNPSKQLAFQVSRAYIKSPEASEPGNNITRATASVIHNFAFGENRYIASTLVWGLNDGEHKESSILLESNLQLDKTAIYGRYEWVQKNAEELDLNELHDESNFVIHAITLGINRVILRKFSNNLTVGVQGSLYISDNRLEYLYGKYPLAGEVYLRLYPQMMHAHNKTMKDHM